MSYAHTTAVGSCSSIKIKCNIDLSSVSSSKQSRIMSPKFQPQQRCLIRKNKVFQISHTTPTQNECLVNFERGLFYFKNGAKRSICVPAEYIPNLCSIINIVNSKETQTEDMFFVVAAQTQAWGAKGGKKRIFLTAETQNGIRHSVKLVECEMDASEWPGYEIEFNLVDVDKLKTLYQKCCVLPPKD